MISAATATVSPRERDSESIRFSSLKVMDITTSQFDFQSLPLPHFLTSLPAVSCCWVLDLVGRQAVEDEELSMQLNDGVTCVK